MKRWRIAVVAGLLAACIAAPARAAEWCFHDPPVNIQIAPGESFTVYVTEGVMGAQNQAALASAKISYTANSVSKDSASVTVYDYIPTDRHGTFATEMIVSSEPFGAGVVYGSTYGTSGSTMAVRFWINPKKIVE
jgi:hypothetical protein